MKIKEHFSQTSLGEIYVKFIGEESTKKDLVLLHDAIGSVNIWGSFPQQLHKLTGRRVVVFDRLGYGKSGADLKARDVDYMMYEATVRLPEILAKLNIQKPILVGHSDGGTIALQFASQFETGAVIAMAAHIYVEEITRKGIDDFFAQTNFEFIKSKLQLHHGEKNSRVLDAWRYTWLSDAYRAWNIENILGAINCPSLIIQGKQDEYATEQHAIDIEKGIGSWAKLHFVDDCGHVPYKQQSGIVLKHMVDFLEPF